MEDTKGSQSEGDWCRSNFFTKTPKYSPTFSFTLLSTQSGSIANQFYRQLALCSECVKFKMSAIGLSRAIALTSFSPFSQIFASKGTIKLWYFELKSVIADFIDYN